MFSVKEVIEHLSIQPDRQRHIFLFVVKFGVNGSEASEVVLFSWASKAPDLGLSDEIQDTLIKNYR